jgi:hypothetical protein
MSQVLGILLFSIKGKKRNKTKWLRHMQTSDGSVEKFRTPGKD